MQGPAVRIEGAIIPTNGNEPFTREAWCQLIRSRSELRSPAPARRRHPLTGEEVIIKATEDAAEVMLADRVVGAVFWSMSDEPLVNVGVEPSAMPLVLAWAAELGGEFRLTPFE